MFDDSNDLNQIIRIETFDGRVVCSIFMCEDRRLQDTPSSRCISGSCKFTLRSFNFGQKIAIVRFAFCVRHPHMRYALCGVKVHIRFARSSERTRRVLEEENDLLSLIWLKPYSSLVRSNKNPRKRFLY